MKDRLINFFEFRHNFVLLSLLGLNFLIKILIFYNTTTFLVSEAGSNFIYLKEIENGKNPDLFVLNYRSILSYIGNFFKSSTGTLDTFFWFQAMLGTFSIYILYLICLKTTENKTSALFAVIMATLLMDYHLLTPVFYYQIFEIFFSLLIIYLTILIFEKKTLINLLLVFSIPMLIYFSVFFRSTLSYFWGVLLIMSGFFVRNKSYKLFRSLSAAGIITLFLFNLLPESKFRDTACQPLVNNFRFYGHTLYGGDGGEGSFVYEKNRVLYEKRLKAFMIKNNYDSVTIQVHNSFQRSEMKEFITKSPIKWLLLQVRKVAYTFGIVPIRDSLELLTTGKLSLKWYLSAFIIQVPYAIILLIFVILIVLFFKVTDFNNVNLFFMSLVLFYLIAGTCLYGHYSERYRQVVIMAGILPISAFYFSKFIGWDSHKSIKRGRYILLILILFIIFSHWGYQAYNVLVVNKERYVKALNLF